MMFKLLHYAVTEVDVYLRCDCGESVDIYKTQKQIRSTTAYTVELDLIRGNAAPNHGPEAAIADGRRIRPVLGRRGKHNLERLIIPISTTSHWLKWDSGPTHHHPFLIFHPHIHAQKPKKRTQDPQMGITTLLSCPSLLTASKWTTKEGTTPTKRGDIRHGTEGEEESIEYESGCKVVNEKM